VNALVTHQESRAIGAVYTFDEKRQMAECLAQSGLFGVKNATQALALMLVAEAEGEHPASIAQDYDIIQGKGARKTHSVLARFQAMGGKVDWHEVSHTRAEATFSHPKGGSVRLDWTIEQAKQAKLTGKDNWTSYARAMLRARLIAEGVRTVYPAAIGGWQVTEEALGPQLSDEQAPPTVRHMGAVDVVTPEATAPARAPARAPAADPAAPAFPQDEFERGLPIWKKAAAKLPVAEVLARAEAANPDFAFTEQQKATILSLKSADASPGTNEQQRAEPQGKHDEREKSLTVEG